MRGAGRGAFAGADPAAGGSGAGRTQRAGGVIFLSHRTGADEAGYAEAAARMEALAAAQPGFRGLDGVRDADGAGITVSWWADEASALAWRAHAEHASIRDRGRAGWYARYEVAVASVGRSYRWSAPDPRP